MSKKKKRKHVTYTEIDSMKAEIERLTRELLEQEAEASEYGANAEGTCKIARGERETFAPKICGYLSRGIYATAL